MSEENPTALSPEANGGVDGGMTAPAPESNWMSGFDENTTGYVQNKGWKEPSDVLGAYRELESFRGVPEDQLVKLPSDPADADSWNGVFNKMGRPETSADYMLPDFAPPEGVEDSTDFYREAAHKNGLSQKQAEGLYADWNAHVSESVEQMGINNQTESAAQVEVEMTGLKKDWGVDYDKNVAIGQRAVQSFDISMETVDAIESALGPRATLEFMAKLGSGTGEDRFVTGNSAYEGAMTQEMASAKITELRGNKDFSKRYLNGDKAANTEIERLLKIKAGIK